MKHSPPKNKFHRKIKVHCMWVPLDSMLQITSFPNISFFPLQLSWWWYLGSAGHLSTLNDWCGALLIIGQLKCIKCSALSMLSLEYYFISVLQSTQSCTTYSLLVSVRCLRRLCATEGRRGLVLGGLPPALHVSPHEAQFVSMFQEMDFPSLRWMNLMYMKNVDKNDILFLISSIQSCHYYFALDCEL